MFMKENKILITGIVFMVIVLGSAFAYKKIVTVPATLADGHIENNYPKVSTTVIGLSTSTSELNIGSTSWSGEILSASDVNVQPKREGTIAVWNIKIGDRVYLGQTIGRLSPPPRTSDVVQAIAGRSEDLTRAKSQAVANSIFTEKKIEQLKQLKSSYNSFGGSANSLSETKKKNVKTVLQSALSKNISAMFTNATDINILGINSNNLNYNIGAIDSNYRSIYSDKVVSLINQLKNSDSLPEQIGLSYFEATLKILSNSITGENLATSDISNLKNIVTNQQQEFVTAIRDYKESLVLNTDKNQDIDSQILQLEKDLALSKSEVVAKQASYNTVVGGLTGGLEITAPHSGTVSTISKQVGEFVRPEDTIASVSEENKNEKLIRFRIPSNGHKPISGDILTVVRPGFLDTKVKIKVLGVGISLDTNGSYMADAQLLENVSWPVHAFVRVIPSNSNSSIASIPFTAIFWSDDGITKVWTVTSENTLLSKNVTAGRTFGDMVEITEGLSRGDIVVTNQIANMQDGMLVNIAGDTFTPTIEPSTQKKAPADESKPHSHDE